MTTQLYGVVIVPAIVGIVQAAKQGGLPGRYAPLCDLALGIVAGFGVVFGTSHAQITEAIVAGVAFGLAASGLYAGPKAVLTGFGIIGDGGQSAPPPPVVAHVSVSQAAPLVVPQAPMPPTEEPVVTAPATPAEPPVPTPPVDAPPTPPTEPSL